MYNIKIFIIKSKKALQICNSISSHAKLSYYNCDYINNLLCYDQYLNKFFRVKMSETEYNTETCVISYIIIWAKKYVNFCNNRQLFPYWKYLLHLDKMILWIWNSAWSTLMTASVKLFSQDLKYTDSDIILLFCIV